MIDSRMRSALLITVSVAAGGGLVELILAGHYADAIQWIPIVTLGVMSVAAAFLVVRPTHRLVMVWRWLMGAATFFALLGVWEHFEGNLHHAEQDQPAASTMHHLWDAAFGGSPLLAPGFLVLIAAIGTIAVMGWDGTGPPPARTTTRDHAGPS